MRFQLYPTLAASLGAFLIFLSFLLHFIPAPNQSYSLQRTPLSPRSEELNRWTRTKFTWNVYLFNTTNPEEVAQGSKPNLQEFGPYVYEVTETKVAFQFNETDDGEDVLIYNISRTARFLRDQSVGPDDAEFTFPNFPLLEVARTAGDLIFGNPPAESTLQKHSDEKLFTKFKVKELLHEGKPVPILKTFKESYNGSINVKEKYKFNVFGVLDDDTEGDSDKISQMMEVGAGSANGSLEDVGRVVKLLTIPDLEIFWGSHGDCKILRGTDGTIFRPKLSKKDRLDVFIPLILRSVYFKFDREVTVDGIHGFRFGLPKDVFDYSLDENSCYCDSRLSVFHFVLRPRVHGCPPDGTSSYPLFTTYPWVVSLPHFYNGAAELQVDGLNPEKERHGSYIDVEPETGSVLAAHFRGQFNFDILDPSRIKTHHVANMSEMLYPVLWFDKFYTVLDDLTVKNALVHGGTSDGILLWVKWALAVFGVVLIAVGIAWRRRNEAADLRERDVPFMEAEYHNLNFS